MSTTQDEPPRRGRGRPRTPGAEKRIIDAALEEYGEYGWSGFTMDGVARRAGVGKSTVYLRWQDKDSLLTDAVGSASDLITEADTGSLRGDLRQVAINLYHHFLQPAGWASLRVLIDTAGAPQPLGHFSERVGTVAIESAARILARAADRGEASADISATAVAETVYGVVVMQVLGLRLDGTQLSDEEIDERADALVDLLLRGVVR